MTEKDWKRRKGEEMARERRILPDVYFSWGELGEGIGEWEERK